MMTSLALIAATCLAFAPCACSSNPTDTDSHTVTGKVLGAWPNKIGVVYGKYWAIGHDTAATTAGSFQVPSWAKAVTAYVDVNQNGKFDRFAEPSGVCKRESLGWKCEVPHQQATLHRQFSTRDAEQHDSTYVIWEDYTNNGIRISQSVLCVNDRCTSLQSSPFLSEIAVQINQMSICSKAEFPTQDAQLHTTSGMSTLHLTQPDRFEAQAVFSRRNGKSIVYVSPTDTDRIVVWTGVSNKAGDVQYVYWTSEDDLASIETVDGKMEIIIPNQEIEHCELDSQCVLVVQLLKYQSLQSGLVTNVTEYRKVVDFRRGS